MAYGLTAIASTQGNLLCLCIWLNNNIMVHGLHICMIWLRIYAHMRYIPMHTYTLIISEVNQPQEPDVRYGGLWTSNIRDNTAYLEILSLVYRQVSLKYISTLCIFWTVDSTRRMIEILFVENFISLKNSSNHFSLRSDQTWDMTRTRWNSILCFVRRYGDSLFINCVIINEWVCAV